jgi:ParB family chromosome partitioning protein
MSPQTRGLGRGLGALIPSAANQPASPSAILMVSVSSILPNPRQPRSKLTPDGLAELTASIREHGIIQPLIVTRAPGHTSYQLVAGERRWRAAQLAGLSEVPVIVKETTPQQHLELALVENLQRADLNALEEAEAYQALMQEFGLSQQEVAERVGKSRVAIANSVRLLRLPAPVKALLADGSLSEGHARALLALEDDETLVRAAEQVIARDLTVRQTEELARRLAAVAPSDAGEADPEPETLPDADTRRLEEAFRAALGTRVALTRGRRGGRIVISFYSDEELQAIYERIVGEQ